MDPRNYSCADGVGLSEDSVTVDYWTSEPHSDTSLASAVVALCFILLGLPSNLLIIFGIIRQRLYTQPTYILLLNLAVSDLLVCLCVLPFTVISGFSREFILGSNDKIRCRVCQTGTFLTLFAGFCLHCLAVLSIDRLIFIKYPLRYFHLVTVRRTAIVLVVLWLLNFVLSIPPLFGFGDIIYHKPVATCSMGFVQGIRLAPNYYYLVILAVISTPPFILILIANMWILFIVQKHLRKLYTIKKASKNQEFIQSLKGKVGQSVCSKQLQLVKVFGAIFIANGITWIPIILCFFLAAINQFVSEWQMFVVISFFLSFVVVHSVIQAWLIPEFRSYNINFLKNVLCPCYRKSSHLQSCTPCCHRLPVNADTGSSDEGLCDSGGSCCVMLSITVLPIRGELHGTSTSS